MFLLEKSHGQRSLVGYSPKGHKELDMAERLSTKHLFNPQAPDEVANPMSKL